MTAHRWRPVLALTIYAAAVIYWLSPLIRQAGSAVPGAGAGDNLTFLWNTWWMRQVLMAGASLFRCPAEFVPFGADLTLNTHTALPSAIAALWPFGASVAAGTNAIVALHLFLNFVTAYALALRATRSHSAALVGGLVFGWCPYFASHLAGHFNLIAAWILPLAVLALDELVEHGGWMRAILLGVVVGGTVYVDYYYAVYAGVLVLGMLFARHADLSIAPTARRPWQSVVLMSVRILIAIDLGCLLVIKISGGTSLRLWGMTVSMRGTDNPVAAAGLLLLLAAALAGLPRCRIRLNYAALLYDARRAVPSIAVAVLVATPVLVSAVRLWYRGDYVSQKYFWKSAPAGIDLATLLLGNPDSLLWGGRPLHFYQHFGINPSEQVAWIAPATLLLCAAALRFARHERRVSRWGAAGLVFMLWALGPRLVAFGHNSAILLPATLIRYIPVVANARIPARAVVVVYLSLAMISAVGFAALRARRRTGLAVALLGLVMVDAVPRPTLVFALDHPTIYDVLRQQREPGAVCELPMGLWDGFGETGRFDARTLWYQTIHERPMTGGFVARLPPGLVAAYGAAPVLGSLLRLSSGQPLGGELMPPPAQAAAALRTQNIGFVVINRDTSPPDLLEYIRRALPLRLLATDGGRDLYVVQDQP